MPGATEFSAEPLLCDSVQVLRLLKRFPDVYEPLIAATTPAYVGGRRRQEGSWALAYLAFLMSGVVEFKTFCDSWASSPMWQEAGFARSPRKSLVHLRFSELEAYTAAFEAAAQGLIARAARHEPRIGRHVHLDGSSVRSHARPLHDCPDREACKARRLNAPAELARLAQSDVEAARHAASALPEDEPDEAARSIEWLDPDDARLHGHPPEMRTRYRWFSQRGHLFRVADLTAGARAYQAKVRRTGGRATEKFNIGGHLLLAVDDLVQAPLAVHAQSASVMEHRPYSLIYDKVVAGTEKRPLAMVIDRGFHYRDVFEHNLRHGTSTIGEWRQPSAGIWPETLECDEFDRHGVPRCAHCGNEGHTNGAGLGLHHDQRGNPYLRFRCSEPHTEPCAKPQRISCAKEPRLLQPINRTHKVFWDLQMAHANKEGMFMTFRQRYKVGGSDFADRVKRRSVVSAQYLRAAGGMLLDWFRACVLNGWLGSARRRGEMPEAVKRVSGRGNWKSLMDSRDSVALFRPYGAVAAALGLAREASLPGTARAGPNGSVRSLMTT